MCTAGTKLSTEEEDKDERMKCIRLSIGSEEGKWSLEVLSLWLLPRVQPFWSGGGAPTGTLFRGPFGATVVVLELPHNLEQNASKSWARAGTLKPHERKQGPADLFGNR